MKTIGTICTAIVVGAVLVLVYLLGNQAPRIDSPVVEIGKEIVINTGNKKVTEVKNTVEPVIVAAKATVVEVVAPVEKVLSPNDTVASESTTKNDIVTNKIVGSVKVAVAPLAAAPKVDKPQTGQLVSTSRDAIIVRWNAVDDFNNETGGSQVFVVVQSQWCQAIQLGSSVSDEHELLSVGTVKAVTHIIQLDRNGSPDDLNALIKFTIAKCKVDSNTALQQIKKMTQIGQP